MKRYWGIAVLRCVAVNGVQAKDATERAVQVLEHSSCKHLFRRGQRLVPETSRRTPVLLHCRLGMIVPGAYQTLKQLRPDIPEIAYIAGTPLFDEYNTWHETSH